MFEGCSPFDVEQSFQPALINNSSSTWLHTPPAQMPWSIPPANQPSVMRFTGDAAQGARRADICKPHTKRKSMDSEIEIITPPVKQLITEEKMAENLNCLHISNSYVSHQIGSNQPMSIPLPESKSVTSLESEAPSTSVASTLPVLEDAFDGKEKTVSLCEQLRKLISESSVIPSPLLNKVERPSNALVLWQPPGGSIFKNAKPLSSSDELKKSKQLSEEDEPKQSTSTCYYPSRSQTHNIIGWSDLLDNNNSSNAMDLNLLPTDISPVLQLQPSDIPLPDDDIMDFPEDSSRNLREDSMMDF